MGAEEVEEGEEVEIGIGIGLEVVEEIDLEVEDSEKDQEMGIDRVEGLGEAIAEKETVEDTEGAMKVEWEVEVTGGQALMETGSSHTKFFLNQTLNTRSIFSLFTGFVDVILK